MRYFDHKRNLLDGPPKRIMKTQTAVDSQITKTRQQIAAPLDPQATMPVANKSLLQRGWDFAQAMVSMKDGTVPDEVAANRLAICTSNICGHLQTEGEKLYCNGCGCPAWRLSELHVKVTIPGVACPLEKPLWDRYKGAV